MTHSISFSAGHSCVVRLSGALLSALCALNSTIACSNEKTEAVEERIACGMTEQATSNYEAFAKAGQSLAQSVRALCDDPSEKKLKEARSAYDVTRTHWMMNRTFAFGPEVEQPLRLGPKIDFQPPRYDDLQTLLEDEGELDDPERTGAHLRGFPALEYVLFGPPAADLEKDSRSCNYLENIAADLSKNAQLLHQAWSPEVDDFSAQACGSQAGTFDDGHEALSGLVNRMGYVIENLRDRDIREVWGEPGGKVREELIISRLSGRSLKDFRDTVSGIEALYWGTDEVPGLAAYGAQKGFDFDEDFSKLTGRVLNSLEELEPSFPRALIEEQDKVVAFDEALSELQSFIQVDLISSLHLSQIFNDSDGD